MATMTATRQNIAVIGAGINGLVAANYLRRAVRNWSQSDFSTRPRR